LLFLTKIRNNLTFLEFRNALITFKVFSIGDAKKLFPTLDTRRLVEWQHKGYIQKLVNKWYLFTEIPIDEILLFRISNCIYRPSYISLESALSYHNLIPEGVYSQQAITTRKTIAYQTPVGSFNYRSVKSSLFFGYEIVQKDSLPVLIAGVEKALLDYLYLSASLKTFKDIEALRFNYTELQAQVDWSKLDKYALLFDSKTLDKRIATVKKLISHANPA
jgi:predicted transcriptional regulator of viral defense system